ncbi:hypothetical protein ABMA28_013306 [Loxostege sticticalis]|uniref:RNA-directed DNA polymerase n=1 Tax=Loxostege sticticalis TaxID=481309 RepID=A0ABD0THW3_LOXSC
MENFSGERRDSSPVLKSVISRRSVQRQPASHRTCRSPPRILESPRQRSRSRHCRQSRSRSCSPAQGARHRSRSPSRDQHRSRPSRSRSRRPATVEHGRNRRSPSQQPGAGYHPRNNHRSRSRSSLRRQGWSPQPCPSGHGRRISEAHHRPSSRLQDHRRSQSRGRHYEQQCSDLPNQPRSSSLKNPQQPQQQSSGENFQSNCSGSDHSFTMLLQALKNIAPDPDKTASFHNTVPEFDPSRKEQTMNMWLHKVNECATIYGWSERQIIHYAMSKLQGVSKRWYEGLPSVLFSWSEWQTKLLAAFPSTENYGQMLSEMLAKRARFGDSLEDYFYEKVALINRCEIVGRRAVECVLHGIDDRAVRLSAEAGNFENLDNLLTYLRNTKSIKFLDKKYIRSLPPKAVNDAFPRNVSYSRGPNLRNRPSRCINCHHEGHFASQCPKPIKTCSKCLRLGHEVSNCYSPTPVTEKSVNRITNDNAINQKFYKMAYVNDIPIKSYVDLELPKLGVTRLDTTNLPSLKGFGNSIVSTLGRIEVKLVVDDAEAITEILIVDDHVMPPLMIGQTFTEQSHIVIHKTNSSLEIIQLPNHPTPLNKIQLCCLESTKITGNTIISVFTNPVFHGELYVESSLRNMIGCGYVVLPGLYHTDADGSGNIAVNGFNKEHFTIKKDSCVARGRVAFEEKPDLRVLHISEFACQNQHFDIKYSDLNENIDPEIVQLLLKLLNKYRKCFALSMSELGKCNLTQMSINLHSEEPVVYRPYRLALKEKEIVRDLVDELLSNEIIRSSTSPYASPVVLVKKRTGEYRLCIDYRALNKKTCKETYPMPLIDDQLDALGGSAYFTTLDLASGYYQIPIKEQDRYKTAFVTPDGHFEFNRMPFGLANTPAVFQRTMHLVLGNLRHQKALAYLDDIIIPSKTLEEGMQQLEIVLKCLLDAGLTLKLGKCRFFGKTVDYLGFEVSKEGIRPGTKKLEAVEKFPIPTNQHTVRQFLGLASFFRRFVQNFSIIAKPLTQLLKKDASWKWGSEQQIAFDKLKDCLVKKPVLALYNPKADTELHTDACRIGIAGILFQRDSDNLLKPIAYFSRQTSPEEQNYTAYDLETLAVVASLLKFRPYLFGLSFKIITDCNSLRATFLKRDLLPRVARWWTQMQEFDFTIEYRPGTSMGHVDALSRNPPIDNPTLVQAVVETDWITTVQNSDTEIQRIIEF